MLRKRSNKAAVCNFSCLLVPTLFRGCCGNWHSVLNRTRKCGERSYRVHGTPCIVTQACSPRYRTFSANHGLAIHQRFLFHPRERKTEVRDLQDPERPTRDLRRHRGSHEGSVLSCLQKPWSRKGARMSLSLHHCSCLTISLKWEIKSLGAGYTVQKVSIPMPSDGISAIVR